MNVQRVLVVSEQPIVSQGLKLIIEGAGPVEVVTAPDEAAAADLIAKLTPSVIVVDREEKEVDPDRPASHEDYPQRLVLLSPNDDRLIVYSREEVHAATLENLLDAIRESQSCR